MPSRYLADAFGVVAKKFSAFPSLQSLYNEAANEAFPCFTCRRINILWNHPGIALVV
jgi:hypothetical protein